MIPVLCAVSDRRRWGGGPDAVARHVAALARAGVHLIQIRERDLEAGALVRLVRECVAAVSGTRARVLVNDRVDVALAAGAHGAHLRGDSMSACGVRAIAGPEFVLGRSVHAVEEGIAVSAAGGLDYLLFGTVFASASKPGVEPCGVAALASLAAEVTLPVLAIGGVTAGRAAEIARAGAAGLAGIGLFAGADAAAAVAEAVRAFDTA